VVCVDERHHEQRLDPALGRLVPEGTDVVRVGALPIRLTRMFGFGEIGLRGYAQLEAGLERVVLTRKPDVVMITGSPFYPMLLAGKIKRRFGLPVVLDFQDPWVSAWGAVQPRMTKAGMSHALATALEPRAVRHADFVTSVSQRQNEEFLQRYPWFAADNTAAIPIGGDPDDYLCRPDELDRREVVLEDEMVNFVYVGTILPRAEAVVGKLFEGLAQLREAKPALAKRVRFTFVGTSNQPNGHASFRVAKLAEVNKVQSMVREAPQRVPYLEALELMTRADVVLMIGSDEPHYTASKIYPALLSGRPGLALFHRASSAFDVLSRCGGARVIGFETIEELAPRVGEIAAAIGQLALDPNSISKVEPLELRPYEADAVAQRFAETFEQVTSSR